MKTILHAREYGFPSPIDLPEEVLRKYNIQTTNYSQEASDIIRRSGDGIDAYVLGMYMPKEGIPLEEVNGRFKVRDDTLLAITKTSEKDRKIDIRRRSRILSQNAYSLIDHKGGIKVFDCLSELGYTGKKPILFWTTQGTDEECALGDDRVIFHDISKKIWVLGMPNTEEEIIEWFSRNLG
jgi:hypothetical protein